MLNSSCINLPLEVGELIYSKISRIIMKTRGSGFNFQTSRGKKGGIRKVINQKKKDKKGEKKKHEKGRTNRKY